MFRIHIHCIRILSGSRRPLNPDADEKILLDKYSRSESNATNEKGNLLVYCTYRLFLCLSINIGTVFRKIVIIKNYKVWRLGTFFTFPTAILPNISATYYTQEVFRPKWIHVLRQMCPIINLSFPLLGRGDGPLLKWLCHRGQPGTDKIKHLSTNLFICNILGYIYKTTMSVLLGSIFLSSA